MSAFISRRDETVAIPDSKIRILHKGILLQDETALMDNNVQNGDTLTAIFDADDDVDDESTKGTFLQEMIEKQKDEWNMFSADIKKGLEATLKTFVEREAPAINLSAPVTENAVVPDIDGKINEVEIRIANQLKFQFAQYERMLQDLSAEQRRLPASPARSEASIIPGNLEDDDDDDIVAPAPLVLPDEGQIDELKKMFSSLKETSVRQEQEIETLKSLLATRPAPSTAVASNDGFTVLKASVPKPVKKNKWKDVSGAEKSTETPKVTEVIVSLQQTEIEAEQGDPEPAVEIPTVVIEEAPAVIEVVREESIAKAAPDPVVVEDLVIIFSKKHNPDLELFGKPSVKVILSRFSPFLIFKSDIYIFLTIFLFYIRL